MRFINDIIVHCTATPPGMDVTADDVKRWHLAKGWKRCGYHYLVKLDGTIEKGCPISTPGIHCRGHNAHSIGVAYVGGLGDDLRPQDTRNDWQKAALLKLLANLTFMYRCKIHGHHDYNQGKACPCFDATAEYAGLYKQIVLQQH